MKHDYHDREDDLSHCKVCNGAEGSLTSDCPQRRMTADEQDAVYAGDLDFKDGAWVQPTATYGSGSGKAKASAGGTSTDGAAAGLRQQVATCVASASDEPLPGTSDSLALLPEPVREAVQTLLPALFRTQLGKLAQEALRSDALAKSFLRKPATWVNSAQLHVMSEVCTLAAMEWHIAGDDDTRRIAAALRSTGDLAAVRPELQALKPLHVFVAALPHDDRDSYLRAVAAAIKDKPVASVIFDGELIEWTPDDEFLAACEFIGMRPRFVGICERRHVGRHSLMSPSMLPAGTRAVAIDTAKRRLRLDDSGAVVMADAAPAPASSTSAAPPTAPPQEAPTTSAAAEMQRRIQGLRATQVRRRPTAHP